MIMVDTNKTYMLVAAIDFGTAYSGYAFSTKSDFERDPLKVCANVWNSGSLMSLKTSTCVLFDKDKNFDSFGFEAEDKYTSLASDNEHLQWYFFKRFKMGLFGKMTLSRNFNIEDETGKEMPAIDVFAAAIKYMKDHLTTKVQQQLVEMPDDDIRWVLTVPAIWNEAAKQFMREAAKMAGICNEDLLISLEPEAASVCCRYLPMSVVHGCRDGFISFAPKSKYLVFDAGGGTVDITVHEVQSDNGLKEVYRANGGSWGGTYIDQAFKELLTEIVGQDVMDTFMKEHMLDYIDIFREFEIKKRSFKNEKKEKVTFKVPMALNLHFKEKSGKELRDHLATLPKYCDKIVWRLDKMRVDAAVVEELFSPACENVAKHLTDLFSVPDVADVPTILMVGGFSESPMLQETIRKTLPDKKIIVPADPGLAVLKGAVIYGHDPSVVRERRCRYTYGAATSYLFQPGVHPEARKYTSSDGKDYCGDMFDCHVKAGQAVVRGEKQAVRGYVPTEAHQTSLAMDFYASDQEEPMFVLEDSCTKIGRLVVDLEGTGLDRFVSVMCTFGDTELHVEAVESKTNKKTNVSLNFLG